MARIVFLGAHRRYTEGAAEITLPAGDFRAAVAAIRERFPAFPEAELLGCTVAIDGEVVTRPWLQKLGPDSSLVFVTRIGAG